MRNNKYSIKMKNKIKANAYQMARASLDLFGNLVDDLTEITSGNKYG